MRSKLLTDYLPLYFPRLRRARTKMADQELTKAQFIAALDALNEKLREESQSLTFLLVGGGALMLAYDFRGATQDLDGILSPSNEETTQLFHRLAREVAKEQGIDQGWINVEVKNIMAGQRFQRSYFETLPQYHWSNLNLLFAKPGYLLSMKCQALRKGRKDFGDVVRLIKLLGIRTLSELEISIEPYGGWDFIGNDEFPLLKLCIAWAFPGQTEYDFIRLNALKRRNGQS